MTQAKPKPSDEPMPDDTVSALLSHDIRSALSRVLGASQMLELAGLEGENAAHLIQIKTAALYINDLLGETVSAPEQVQLTELAPALAHLQAMWKVETAQKGLRFALETKGIMPGALRLPQIDFLRIFNNIIGNALKFTTSGALEVRLARVNSGALLIEVVDDGPGFSDEARATLFSLHGRPKTSSTQGSGYGLYIGRSLVERAGGSITAENRPSGGARVSVVFPEDLLVSAATPVVAKKPKAGLPDLSHLKILLAEDNPTNQLVATQMLKRMRAQVDTAADGVEALALLEKGTYNLGLIDIEMPRKSGLEVMREIRARPDEKADMTLLALTAYVLPEHRERITKAGAEGIIAKPLTDLAAFGNAILIFTGEREVEAAAPPELNPDADIQMDIYDGLKEIIGHDSMLELLGKVRSDLGNVLEGVAKGASERDVALIRANTHILISVAGAIGAVNLQHIAEQLNATAKTEDWARILPDSERCKSGISQVLRFVDGELES